MFCLVVALLPSRGGVFAGKFVPNKGVCLEASNVANSLLIKPFEPYFAAKLPVHGQDMDLFGLHDAQDILKEFDAMLCVGVSAFGGLWQNSPSDGNGNPVDHDANSENVDMPLAILPIGSVHGEDPPLLGAWNLVENKASDGCEVKDGAKKKSLEATVATLVGGPGEVFGGQ